IVFELDLRDAMEAKPAQELQRVVRERRSPTRFCNPCGPDLTRRLLQLPPREQPQLFAVARQVRADRPQRVVAPGDPLLRERAEVACWVEPPFDLLRAGAPERLDPELPSEPGRVGRLDEHGKAERIRGFVRGARSTEPLLRSDGELVAFVLDRLQDIPGGKRA